MRLQLLRGGQRDTFLYDEEVVDGAIRLKPGVVYCLRRFSSLLGCARPQRVAARGSRQPEECVRDRRHPEPRIVPLRRRASSARTRQGGAPAAAARQVLLLRPRLTDDHTSITSFRGRSIRPTSATILSWPTRRATRTSPTSLRTSPISGHWRARNEGGGRDLTESFASCGIVTDLAASQGIARWAYRARRNDARGGLVGEARNPRHGSPRRARHPGNPSRNLAARSEKSTTGPRATRTR